MPGEEELKSEVLIWAITTFHINFTSSGGIKASRWEIGDIASLVLLTHMSYFGDFHSLRSVKGERNKKGRKEISERTKGTK